MGGAGRETDPGGRTAAGATAGCRVTTRELSAGEGTALRSSPGTTAAVSRKARAVPGAALLSSGRVGAGDRSDSRSAARNRCESGGATRN
ncbi:hypothetical protein Aph02nite_03720 [Actinoplanes philippinensis]|uniref:Uncharacterized protein n=1 Tax=Actinoplanes philippinensis TaxID=35752 RepID=A0A1I2D7P2_9ACTN|nr:hypothetical protein Aph02nite_03720 [Actinoplanes philippinensis]SFE76471.1 hypothetical protein SAMN05421541_103460 [Actinoplanes philippinensis]